MRNRLASGAWIALNRVALHFGCLPMAIWALSRALKAREL